MTEAGLAEVEAAKADGRWDRAYPSAKAMTLPDDLQAAIDADPAARETFSRLNAQNRYALAFRLHNLKTEAGRRRTSPPSSTCSGAARRSTRSVDG